LAALFAGPLPLAALVTAFAAVGLWEWVRMCRDRPGWLSAGALVLGAAGAAIVWIRYSVASMDPVLWLFGAVWATDIGAYAAGRTIGGPRIAPAISPNKTWAGLAGGMILAAAWSFAWAVHNSSYFLEAIAVGAATAAIAQAGDFALSFAKRRFGRKDSSDLIPGHGGVLDRIAGLLTTGPALALLLQFEAVMNATMRLTRS
jgi:phosphatidate cytidylyltransferase